MTRGARVAVMMNLTQVWCVCVCARARIGVRVGHSSSSGMESIWCVCVCACVGVRLSEWFPEVHVERIIFQEYRLS